MVIKMKIMKCFFWSMINVLVANLVLISIALLRSYFINDNPLLKTLLTRYGFHYAIASNPHILFVNKNYNHKTATYLPEFSISLLLRLIRKSIKIGVWTGDKNQSKLRTINIVEPFCVNFNLFLRDVFNPVVTYQLDSKHDFKRRVAIYSVVTGDYDIVYDPLYISKEVDYILFTNNRTITSQTWEIRYIESDLNNLLLSRSIKMLPQQYLGADYEFSVYVDANVLIYGDIGQLTSLLSDNVTLALTCHSERCTIKEEIVVCCKKKHISEFEALRQYSRYVEEGFTDELGLPECGILIRNHSDNLLNKTMELWWNEYVNGVKRDQISLMYCIWKMNFVKYNLIDGSVWNNQFCRILSHKEI